MSSAQPTALRRQQPIQKAARLIAEDRVTLLPAAFVYEVRGDTSTYRVIADADSIVCSCPATTSLCAHVLATAALRQQVRSEFAGII
jgi:hypothetical protein